MTHLKLYHLLFGLENWFTFSNNFRQMLGQVNLLLSQSLSTSGLVQMGRIIPLKSVTISCCRYQPLLQFFSAAKLLGSPASTCRQIKPSGWEIINLAILCFKRYCIHVLMCVYFLVVCLELGQLEVCSIWCFGGARKMRGCTSWMCARVW